MKKAILISLFLISFLIIQLSAGQQIVLAYQKTYSIFVSGQRVYDFLIYPKDNATVLFQFTYPAYQAYYVRKGESRAYQVNTAQFELSLLDVAKDYIILDLVIISGDVKIADPTQIAVLAASPAQQQTNSSMLEKRVDDLQQEIKQLESRMQQLENKISRLNASTSVDPSVLNRIQQLESRMATIQQVNPAEISDLQNKIVSILQMVQQLNTDVQQLKKSKESWINNPQFQEMIQQDPKLALIVVALDPTLSDEQKQQMLTQMIITQKENEKKAQQTMLIASAVIIGLLILGLVIWLKLSILFVRFL